MQNKNPLENEYRGKIREAEEELETLQSHFDRLNFMLFMRSISEKTFCLLKEEHSRLLREIEEQKEQLSIMKQRAKDNKPIIKTLPEPDRKINIIWYFDRQDQLRMARLTLERERAKFLKHDPSNRMVIEELSRIIDRLEAEQNEISEILDNAFYP